jgi:hypothetical protein
MDSWPGWSFVAFEPNLENIDNPDILRVPQLWQFYRYQMDITRILVTLRVTCCPNPWTTTIYNFKIIFSIIIKGAVMSKSNKKPAAITKKGVNNKDRKELARPQHKYTQEEQRLIDDYLTRSKIKPLKHKARGKKGNIQALEPEGDRSLALAKMAEAFGSADHGLQMFLFNQVVQTFKDCQSSAGLGDEGKMVELCDNAMAILQGIKPQDEIEGMLAVQMVGVHNMVMDAIRLAMISDQYPDARDRNTNRANKLLKTFALQLEALKKYRTGGQQKMTVEHVHVNKGGQAIVGSVTQREGGRKNKK